MRHNAVLRVDPTRTGMIQRRWIKEINKRFGLLKKMIWESVVDNDCFGLVEQPKVLGGPGSGNFGHAGIPGHQGGSAPDGEGSGFNKTMSEKEFVLPKRAQMNGAKLVWVDTKKFDEGFQKDQMYIGPGGTKGIGDRYQTFAEYFKEHKSIEVSEVVISKGEWSKRGTVGFINGRHRYAYMRDQGASKIPVALYLSSDTMSLEDAQKEGFVVDTPSKPKALEAIGHKAFKFSRSPDKAKGFMDWLADMNDKHVLETSYSKTGRKVTGDSEWQKVYVDSAYKNGLRKASSAVAIASQDKVDRLGRKRGFIPPGDRAVDSAFLAPVHADAMGLIYTRTFQDLKNVTEAMDTGISRSLSMGLANGWGPREIAREMLDEVDDIGITRARMIARTETVWAHNEAALNVYEEAGLEGVTVEVEWSTAFHNVCPDCADLQGRVFTLDEAREIHPPLHPNCRCSLIPAGVGEAEETRGQYDEKTIGPQYKDKEGDFELAGIFEEKVDFDKPDRELR
jgi:SPP1 gp7 family putative phage head morphogenesis protein